MPKLSMTKMVPNQLTAGPTTVASAARAVPVSLASTWGETAPLTAITHRQLISVATPMAATTPLIQDRALASRRMITLP